MNSFAYCYDDKPVEALKGWIFKDEFNQAVNVLTGALWDKLSYRARAVFDSFLRKHKKNHLKKISKNILY